MPKILVADDSIAVRKVAERLLTEAGFGVALAANGEEALAYLAKERPDVIVSDVIMPDKSGYEVCAFVRSHSLLSSTPVLLISGIVNSEVTRQADLCRANGVLKKPFQGTSLKDRVLELFARRQELTPPHTPRSGPDQGGSVVSEIGRSQAVQPEVSEQATTRLREMEDLLRTERARTEELSKHVAYAAEQIATAKGQEEQLRVERQRVADLEAGLSKVSTLEASLKAEQDVVRMLKQEVVTLQQAVDRIPELESAIETERVTAGQLVQQLADVERVAERVTEADARVAATERHTAQLMEQVRGLETALAGEQQQAKDARQRLEDAQRALTRAQEVEALLEAERQRNALLSQRVLEAEQAAEGATKRFEEMARKLAEIANLASQLGSGKG